MRAGAPPKKRWPAWLIATNTGALLVRTTDGTATRNPLIKIAADAAADMLAFARQFAMTQAPHSARFRRLRTITAVEVR
jgi:phage terminase small subunit